MPSTSLSEAGVLAGSTFGVAVPRSSAHLCVFVALGASWPSPSLGPVENSVPQVARGACASRLGNVKRRFWERGGLSAAVTGKAVNFDAPRKPQESDAKKLLGLTVISVTRTTRITRDSNCSRAATDIFLRYDWETPDNGPGVPDDRPQVTRSLGQSDSAR